MEAWQEWSASADGDGMRSDGDLLALVRGGDAGAFESLYRRHVDAARRIAHRIAGPSDADDVLSEAFLRVFRVLQNGGGPTVSFRAYLTTAINSAWIDTMRRNAKAVAVDHDYLEPLLTVDDDAARISEREALTAALVELPPRWQHVLWLTAVEGIPHAEVGELLDLKPAAVAMLALRARRGLEKEYLAQHLDVSDRPQCRLVGDLIPEFLSGRAAPARVVSVEGHLAACAPCRAAVAELRRVRADVSGLLVPAVLGAGWVLSASGGVSAPLAVPASAVASVASVASVGGGAWGLTLAKVAVALASGVLAVAGGITLYRHSEHRAVPQLRAGLTTVAPFPSPRSAMELSGAGSKPQAQPPLVPLAPPPAPAEADPAAPVPRGQSTTSPGAQQPSVHPSPDPRSPRNDPRIVSVTVTSSPRGQAWRRVQVRVADQQPGLVVALSAQGGAAYCDQTCTTSSPDRTWLGVADPTAGSVRIDVRPATATTVRIRLDGSGWQDDDATTSNDQRTVVIPAVR